MRAFLCLFSFVWTSIPYYLIYGFPSVRVSDIYLYILPVRFWNNSIRSPAPFSPYLSLSLAREHFRDGSYDFMTCDVPRMASALWPLSPKSRYLVLVHPALAPHCPALALAVLSPTKFHFAAPTVLSQFSASPVCNTTRSSPAPRPFLPRVLSFQPIPPSFSATTLPHASRTVLRILRRPRALPAALVEPAKRSSPVPAQVHTVLEGSPFLVQPPSSQRGAKSAIAWSLVPVYHFFGAFEPGEVRFRTGETDFVGDTLLRTYVYPAVSPPPSTHYRPFAVAAASGPSS